MDAVAALGYAASINDREAEDDDWLVQAQTHMVVNAQTIAAARAFFTTLADEHGGDFDGWSTSVADDAG